MQQRPLGRTGRTVSALGLGTWQLGADWGEVSESDALAVLEASVRNRAGTIVVVVERGHRDARPGEAVEGG